MAEQTAQDVVDQSQSVGDVSPSGAPATTSTTDYQVAREESGGLENVTRENGVHSTALVKLEDLEEISGHSDTDTSRADGSVAEDKASDQKPLKKFAAKPVSFAKYSVPKVIAASTIAKGADKVTTPISSTASLQPPGRPRLVAKTTSSIQQKIKLNKNAAPDPMQVWNKNRVTPQPSTKHLTDEELKQQYGIHLTSRLQSDENGKEAKWADIDDDEDDWAPETIEWNDGTKSTLNTAEVAAAVNQKGNVEITASDILKEAEPAKVLAPQFTSTIGPNATVLKLGASAERQLKTIAQQPKGSGEKPTLTSSKTAPAPTPSKSPWAPLPPVEKVSPIAINPQPMAPPARLGAYSQSPSTMNAPSPAKEISADDFNRSWRESQSGQPRELFIPNSGRYEAVPEGRRRLSKNDQSFRAPAVLQRPSPFDLHAPAEPSPAFQTTRSSVDQARRRASSTLSGGSGQLARRMSMRSGEGQSAVLDGQQSSRDPSIRPSSRDGPQSQLQTPTYQARASNADYISSGPPPPTDADLEVQRAQQRALMKENIERARRRKIEEEEREEAAKKERIRQKLASLGPPPEKTKDEPAVLKNEVAVETTTPVATVQHQSPPKPPQPLASGEPQQYGMMKVHALDTVKKSSHSVSQPSEPQNVVTQTSSNESTDKEPSFASVKPLSPLLNGDRPLSDAQRQGNQDTANSADPSRKSSKPLSVPAEARNGWGDLRHDHRSPPTGNLWGLPNNKALGNGTFDQSLAGYAPQDLSRTSSSGWMNGRTPTAGRSPQPQYVSHHVADARSQLHHSVTSPDQPPLAADSEVDSLFPITRPAPIAPPQLQAAAAPVNDQSPVLQNASTVTSWQNFHHVASQQERTENEKLQRDLAARREEEMRTGVRQGPQYTFNETWKQVSLGDHAGQRQVHSVAQTSIPQANSYGAVGSIPVAEIPLRNVQGPPGRGSRFFPQNTGNYPTSDRRAVTYSHIEVPRTPSPPPAEEHASLHPAFDGDYQRPVVHFPREKAVVKLPPAMPPTPPSPVQAQAQPAQEQVPQTPLTWAARVSMPAPIPTPPLRTVSTPIVQNPSWQERFNGLLGKRASPVRQPAQLAAPAPAVTSSTREPLEVLHAAPAAAVSLPQQILPDSLKDAGLTTSKDVEQEDDLFEDREVASLPAINFPREYAYLPAARVPAPRVSPTPVDPTSINAFMVNNLYDRQPVKQHFAIIRVPGSMRSVKKDIPTKTGPGPNTYPRPRNPSGPYRSKHNKGTPRPRQASAKATH